MAAIKPRTGDGPLEVEREIRSFVLRIPVDGGGRFVLEMNSQEIAALREVLESIEE